MTIHTHIQDLPDDIEFGNILAVDTEAMGLKWQRDRLCVIQLSDGNGEAHLIHFPKNIPYESPNIKKLLSDTSKLKLFHYARFDIGILKYYLDIDCTPLYCTKIASKLARTYTDRHGLRDLCRELLGVDLSKQQQSSDWGADQLTHDQQNYAASDVLHLHELKEKLDVMLEREGRLKLARDCFEFLPTRIELDIQGWENHDIFSHMSQ